MLASRSLNPLCRYKFKPEVVTSSGSKHYLRLNTRAMSAHAGERIPEVIRPPFNRETALKKVKAAEKAWNTRNPPQVSLGYTPDSIWRNRDTFLQGREAIVKFLTKKWEKEHLYVLRKDLFAFTDDKIAVQFFYEWNEKADASGQWFRTYGLEDWTFDRETGLMRKRMMSGNDVRITNEERWFTKGSEHVDEVEITEQHL